MKTRLSPLVFALPFLLVTLAYADLNLKKFALEPGFNKVTVRWEVQNESDLRGYEVQRGLSEADFAKVGFVDYKPATSGVNKYEFVDKTVFKSSNTSRTYFYRLKITKVSGAFTYSAVEKVSPTISSARQTWGSIKAMFR